MRMKMAGGLMVAAALATGQGGGGFHHLYTFGSKQGIHPRTLLNRRAAIGALGRPENPYGLVFPVAAAADLHGRVWIADSGTASVHVFDQASGGYREIRRVGDTPLIQPSGLAADSQGRIFLSDAGAGTLFMFDEKGEYDHALSKPGKRVLEAPAAIALSEDQKTIYVADPPKGVVVALNREGEVDGMIAIPAELGQPESIAVIHNQVYVLGSRQHRVGVFSPNGKQRGEFLWDGIPAPSAFAYDPARRRFVVANPRWMTVEVFDDDGRSLGAFGQIGDAIDQMQHVDAVQVDADGRLYLVDSKHGKVLVFGETARGLE